MSRRVFISISGILVSWLVSWFVYESPAAPKSSCQRALTDYRVAVESYQDGLLDPAFAGFKTYLKQCPNGSYAGQAHYVLATIMAKREQFTKALSHIEKALSQTLEPAIRPQALILGAQSALKTGKQEVARTYLQQVVTSKADGSLKSPAFYWLGEMADRAQQGEEAQRYYQWAIQEAPQGPYAPPAHYALGWIARQQGDAKAALAAFDAFLKLAPSHQLAPQVRLAQADLLRENGQTKAASAAFRQFVQNGSTELRDEALFRWAETAYQLQQYDEARTAYDQLLSEFPESSRAQEALYGKGWTAVQLGTCEAAVEPWETLLARNPEFAQASDMRYHLGMCAMQRSRYADARRYLKQAVASISDGERQRDVTVKLATLAFHAKAYDEAIQYYSHALNGASQDASYRLHYLLGESYHAVGDHGQAVEHWKRAIQGEAAQPFEAQVLYRLGTVYLAQSDWDQAILILRRLWDHHPQFTERRAVAAGLAQAYGQTQNCDEALRFYAARSELNAALAEASEPGIDKVIDKVQVACLFTLKRYDEVVTVLAPALAGETAVVPTLDDALLYTLGQSSMQLQQFELAVKAFDRLQQQFSQSPLVASMAPRYAFALEKTGQPKAAIDVWQRVLQSGEVADEVESQRLQLHVGRLALQARRFDVASAWLSKIRTSSHPKIGAEALYWSGDVFRQQEQLEPAISVYLELLRRYPAEAHWVALARLRLGMIYEVQQEWDQALEIYQTLRDSAADAEVIANAQRRIGAIKAGRVLRRPPSKG